jgi:hypothetical protein
MTVNSIEALVRDEINRGTKYDSRITSKLKQAVKWIERAYTFKHMEKYAEVVIDPTKDNPRTISIPPGFKRMEFMRVIVSESDIRPIFVANPQDIDQRKTDEYPTGYWQDGMDYFWFDNTPENSVTVEMGWIGYSVVPSDKSKTLWILDNMEDIVVAQTMLLLSPILKLSTKQKNEYKEQRNDGMETAAIADRELRETNTDWGMHYDGERFGST